jgi:putative selenium metabolism protein SsnA
MTKCIGNGVLVTQDENLTVIKDGCVAVEGNRIIDLGETDRMRAAYQGAEFLDAKGAFIMPGMINTHGHIYSALARGMHLADAKPSKTFSDILENLWWRMDRGLDLPEIRSSAYTTYIDCIKNGVTTFFDHHASAGHVRGSLLEIADAAKRLGIRTSLCYEVSDRDGGEVADQGIRENAAFIEFARTQEDEMIKGMFGLHASFTLSDETLKKCVRFSQGAGFHVHVAEGPEDLDDSLRRYGKRVVERLADLGILGERSIAVHCIHINEHEMDLLRESGTMVVHNPESNMGNAVGYSAAVEMMKKGILVGLGTDGYTTDMLESLKVANLLHKHELKDPGAAWAEAPQMLFSNNAAICARFFESPLGILKKGALADIIVAEYDAPTPVTAGNVNAHILFGIMGRSVSDTMINGEYVMKNREILTVDEQDIYAESRSAAEAFWRRA